MRPAEVSKGPSFILSIAEVNECRILTDRFCPMNGRYVGGLGLSDHLIDGRKIQAVAIVINYIRLSPALDVRFSDRDSDEVETLKLIAIQYGGPKSIRFDQGPEFISKDFDVTAYQHDVVLDFSKPD